MLMFHQLEFGYFKYITSHSFLNIVGLKLVVSLHSDSDVQKKKRRSLKDFRLILEGWVVGFEPTTFRTTNGISCTCNILIYSDFIICYLCPAKYMLKFLHTTEYLKYVRNQLYRNILWLIFF